MRIHFTVPEYTIQNEYQYMNDVLGENKQFPVLTIGRDSYIGEAYADTAFDEQLIYNIHIGRYSSIAANIHFLIDMNHDYRKVSQGYITGVPYCRPELIKRKGQIVIMNDCWIGDFVTILSGVTIGNGAVIAANSVVTKNIPPYAIVAGNPAKIIGYRFEKSQIEALNLIRWWNWSAEQIRNSATDLHGDIDEFIQKYINTAKHELSGIIPADTKPIPKENAGEEKIFLYIPDFEQDYPTYQKVIEQFIQTYSDTNYELLLYIEEDEFLNEKLALLDNIFALYKNANCYINLFIGNIADKRSLFCQVDAYITNRSTDNVLHMDMADLFELPVISSVDFPIFEEKQTLQHMVKVSPPITTAPSPAPISTLIQSMHTLAAEQKKTQALLAQLSANQYGLDHTIDNLKYEILSFDKKPAYPTIESIEETLEQILHQKKSICRFGDGEFAIMAGKTRQKFQNTSPALANRLKEVLHSKEENILIGIADNYGDLSQYSDYGKYNIRIYLTEETRKEHYALLDMNRIYSNAYLSRPYSMYADNNTNAPQERFDHLKQIWNNRKLLIIEGTQTRMGIGNDLLDNAADIIRILGPAEHAFDQYDTILSEALKQEKDRLVLIAMGATATVLAYDLALAGFQALDIGHIDIEYEWMLEGTGGRTRVKDKYTNEVPGGEIVNDIQDPVYESQIVAIFD